MTDSGINDPAVSVSALMQRVDDLESRLEFQDETITKLNDEMVLLQGRLFEQEKTVKFLTERLRAKLNDNDGAEPQDEPPPPHY